MKVYIAGPMTGQPNNNRAEFYAADELCSAEGHVVLNPAVLPDGLSQFEYMDICLAMLRCADAIFMLCCWQSSAGARAEHALAEKWGIDIIYQDCPHGR